jgi:hypothetical protein
MLAPEWPMGSGTLRDGVVSTMRTSKLERLISSHVSITAASLKLGKVVNRFKVAEQLQTASKDEKFAGKAGRLVVGRKRARRRLFDPRQRR